MGVDCADEVCGPDCLHGECVDNKCISFKGFVGRDCATKTCGGKMGPGSTSVLQFCSGHGVCSVDHQCECNDGFVRPICEHRACKNNCSDHGLCLGGQCLCDDGFAGAYCGRALCSSECDKHGECVQGKCACDPGYSGVNCG